MLDSVKNILRTWIEGEFLFSEDYLVGGRPFLLFGHLIVFARYCAQCWHTVEDNFDLVLSLEEENMNQ